MNFIDIILLSLTSCIDSFIICILLKNSKKSHFLVVPFIFALFQFCFVISGYYLTNIIENYISQYLKFVVFLTFSFLAMKLTIDTFIQKNESNNLTSIKPILCQAALTSFDSLFLGIPLAFNENKLMLFVIVSSITTFIICLLALLIQKKISTNIENKITIIGAMILFFFAFKSLIL